MTAQNVTIVWVSVLGMGFIWSRTPRCFDENSYEKTKESGTLQYLIVIPHGLLFARSTANKRNCRLLLNYKGYLAVSSMVFRKTIPSYCFKSSQVKSLFSIKVVLLAQGFPFM